MSANLPTDMGIRCAACGGNVPRTGPVSSGPVYHYECAPRAPTPLEEYRRVVEMWASYRFRCSDTPSPEMLDRLLGECDDATTALVRRYGFAHKESELFSR